MTRIDKYLTPNGRCRVSQYEAKLVVSAIKSGKIYPSITDVSESDIALLQAEHEAIVAAYKAGELIHTRDDVKTVKLEGLKEEIIIEDVTYADGDECLPRVDRSQAEQISEMDPEALTKEVRAGKINPPMPGIILKSGRPRIPTGIGFAYGLNYGHEEAIEFIPTVGNMGGKADFTLLHTTYQGDCIPTAMNAKVSNVSGNITEIANRSEENPIGFRYKASTKGMQYTLEVLDKENLPRITPGKYVVSKEEQEYWKAKMPLPKSLQKKLDEAKAEGDVKRTVDLITSYIGGKNEIGLSNFRYANHKRLGQFFRENADDLPLLMNEMKVGHCDLLSWYVTAQLRGQGINAWVYEDVLPTKDGAAFNDSYRHSTVVIEMEDGKLKNYDPTKYCNYDRAYNPHIMDDSLIDELEGKLLDAETSQEKAEIIRNFNEEVLPALRSRKSEETEAYLSELMEVSSITVPEPSKFDHQNVLVDGAVGMWRDLPNEVTIENINRVINQSGIRSMRNLVDFRDQIKNDLRSVDNRLASAWLLSSFAELRLPWTLRDLNEGQSFEFLDFHNDADIARARNPMDYPGLYEIGSLDELIDALGSFEVPGSVADHRSIDYRESFALVDYTRYSRSARPSQYEYSELFKNLLSREFFCQDFDHLGQPELYKIVKGKDEPVDFSRQEKNQLLEDVFYYSIEFQNACLDRECRDALLDKLEISENRWKDLQRFQIMLFDSHKPKKVNKAFSSVKIDDDLKDLFTMLTVDSRSREVFRLAIGRALSRMDHYPSAGNVVEPGDIKQYSPGDDLRRIDWNLYARTNDLYIKDKPVRVRDVSSPLHVVFGKHMNTGHNFRPVAEHLQQVEMIRYLQDTSRKNGREVYIATIGSDYYKLPLDVPPEQIYSSIFAREKSEGSFVTAKGIPQNLLYVASSKAQELAFNDLYGKKSNAHAICLRDREFELYPLLKQSFIQHGLQDAELN